MDTDGISVATDALTLNGGSIRSEGGTDAVLDLGAHAITNAADHKVDGSIATAPEVDGVGISSSPSNGIAYGAGETITVWVPIHLADRGHRKPPTGTQRGQSDSPRFLLGA